MKTDIKIDSKIIISSITAIIFVVAGAIPITLNMGMDAGLSTKATSSIVMCGTGIGALFSVFLSYKLKIPIFIAPSITAIAVMAPMFARFSLGEMVFAYIVSGIVIFILGVTGLVGIIGEHIPLPIVLAMVAGVFMDYGLGIVSAVKEEVVAGVLILGAFLLTSLLFKKIPPQAASLTEAILVTVFLFRDSGGSGSFEIELFLPEIVMPSVDLSVLLYVSLPMTIMSIADIYKGFGVLKANGYEPPLNTITKYCGISSIITAFGLGHSVSMAGPTMAIISSDDVGEKKYRFMAGVVFSGVTVVIVLFAGAAVSVLGLMHTAVIDIVCGLAMISLLTSSLKSAFGSGKFILGALTAFLIGLSHLSICGIGAPVWGIVFGLIVSFFVEKKDFSSKIIAEKEAN